MRVIATLKLKQAPKSPLEWTGKKGGLCPLAGKHCTDVTGAHHSMIIEGSNLTTIFLDLTGRGFHVTRLEVVEE